MNANVAKTQKEQFSTFFEVLRFSIASNLKGDETSGDDIINAVIENARDFGFGEINRSYVRGFLDAALALMVSDEAAATLVQIGRDFDKHGTGVSIDYYSS